MKIEKEPISGQYGKFKIDGIDYRIYWEEAGQGIPLVCLHMRDLMVDNIELF